MTEIQRFEQIWNALNAKLDAEHAQERVRHAAYEARVAALLDARELVGKGLQEAQKAMAPR